MDDILEIPNFLRAVKRKTPAEVEAEIAREREKTESKKAPSTLAGRYKRRADKDAGFAAALAATKGRRSVTLRQLAKKRPEVPKRALGYGLRKLVSLHLAELNGKTYTGT